MLSFLSVGLGNVISIIYIPIMLRLLGQSEYGLYNLSSSIVSYLGLLNFGMGSAYFRYYFKFKSNNDTAGIAKLNGMFLLLFSMMGAVSVLAGIGLIVNAETVLGSKVSNGEIYTAKVLMSIMIISVAISFPAVIFNSLITANEKFVFQKVVQLLRSIVNPFLIIPVLLLGYGNIGMAIITTVIGIITEILNIIYCYRKLKIQFSFNNFDFKLMKEMIAFSSYTFLYIITDLVLWNVDKIILGRFWGTKSVAIFSIATQFSFYYLSIATVISDVFVPRVNNIIFAPENQNNNVRINDLMIRVGRLQFIVLLMVLIGIVVFGREFIEMWAGPEYRESYNIILLLLIPVTIPYIQCLGISIQRAKNKQRFLAVVYVFMAFVNVLISIPLGKIYGGVGSAVGTAIALFLGNGLIANWYYHYKLDMDMQSFWKAILQLVPSLIIPIVFGTLIYRYANISHPVYFIVAGVSFVLIYAISTWNFGMNSSEKLLVTGTFQKFKKIKI